MNVTFPVRRSEQPVQIGSRHGYRIDGDVAHLNAELSVPPYHPGGSWALELWASERDYAGGELSGIKVSEVQFDLPTPLAPHTHRVEAQTPARLPVQGVAHTMLLALVELDGAERRVHDVASYPALETFPAPHFAGPVGYQLRGHEVALQAAAVVNPRSASNFSGTLSLELWASAQGSELAPESGGGICLAAAQLAPIAGGQSAQELECRAAFNEPQPGLYTLELLLREWTQAFGYLTRDRRSFDLAYRVAAAEPLSPAELASDEVAPEAVTAPVSTVAVEAVAVPVEPAAEVAEVVAAPVKAVAVEAVAAPVKAVAVEAVAAPVKAVAVETVTAPVKAVAVEAVAAPVKAVAAPVKAVAVESVTAPVKAVAVEARVPESVPPAPVGVPRTRVVSIQTASAEELARVKGLNLKIAKEIIKARPFAAVEDLLRVQGVGRKTFDKIRSLITL